ncbi:Mitochondrial zinc maintenance protein, partial [Lachnellula suecica]
MSLAAYRHLLRSTRIAFQGPTPTHSPSPSPHSHQTGDLPLLKAARSEARTNFLKNASLRPEDPELAPAIAHAEQVAKILLENIVQGKNEGGDMYKLRIHEHTE